MGKNKEQVKACDPGKKALKYWNDTFATLYFLIGVLGSLGALLTLVWASREGDRIKEARRDACIATKDYIDKNNTGTIITPYCSNIEAEMNK